MNPLRYIKALFGLGDVDAFWMAREEILKRPGKHCLENYLCKIIRKHYGAGIPILPAKFSGGGTNHWQQLLNWCRCENYRKCPCRQ